MSSYQYNVYGVDWRYLGCFWSGNPYLKNAAVVGDYMKLHYSGTVLNKQDKEVHVNEMCYIKWMEYREFA